MKQREAQYSASSGKSIEDPHDLTLGEAKFQKLVVNVLTVRAEQRVAAKEAPDHTDEILVSEEEAHRTIERGKYYVVQSMLPEVCENTPGDGSLKKEYSSSDDVMDLPQTISLLKRERLMMEDVEKEHAEVLR